MTTTRLLLFAGTALGFALAASPALAQSTTETSGTQTSTADSRSEDIVVTAQRREQTLLEVPQSISVIGGETLERQQATSFADYAQLVPGLSLTQENPGETRLILRGVNTGSVGSTVAVYVDDVPFGSSGSLSNGGILAGDFDTFDIARVEVLKGPQGTLYGANSLGGVLKFITAAPTTEKFEGRGQGGVETVESGETGYFGNAVVNVPLGDKLAVRGSGYYRKIGGYIDATGRNGKNINGSESYGGRASLLFKPTDAITYRAFALIQNIDVDSPSTFEVNPVTLRPVNGATGATQGTYRTRYERYPELNTVDYRLYSGTLDWDFGFATLTSVTSWATQKQRQISDISTNGARGTAGAVYGAAAGGAANVGLAYQNDIGLKKFTSELRLASPDSDVFEWLIGGYYTREGSSLFQRYLPFVLATQALIPRATTFGASTFQEFVTANINAQYKEYAGFASGTLHLGPRFDITGGGRYSHNDQTSTQAVIQLGSGVPMRGKSSEGVFTYSVSPRFELSDRASIYARVAKGYRPGGPTFIPPGAPANYPTQFNSDTLVSYEGGIRGETADRTFGLDVSGYYIDWDDILIVGQVQTSAGPVTVNTNGRRARTYGAELTATARPIAGLSVIGNIAYNRSKLLDDTTNGTPGLANVAGGLAGEQLPYSPRYTANVSADYDFQLTEGVRAFVGGNIRVVGDQGAGFSNAYRTAFGRRLFIDGYQTVDLRGGLNLGGITLSVYAKNLTNEYGLVNAGGYPLAVPTVIGGGNVPLLRASSIRPRTIGGSVGFSF